MQKAIFGIAAFAAAFIASSALADDSNAPIYKAPPRAVYNWSGCYVGALAGFSEHNTTVNQFDYYSWVGWSNGGNLGGEIGCNLQDDTFVYGVEVDGSWLSNNASQQGYEYGTQSWSVNWLSTFRLRTGITAGKTLFYVTYGAALGHTSSTSCYYGAYYGGCSYDSDVYSFQGSATKLGWVVGVGLERAIMDSKWTAKVEALYVDLGDYTLCSMSSLYGCNGYYGTPYSVHNAVYIARVGLNYKFYSGGMSLY